VKIILENLLVSRSNYLILSEEII